MEEFKVHPIGEIKNSEKGVTLSLNQMYIPALKALDGFSHVNVIWWFNDFDDDQYRSVLETDRPYKNSPEKMGLFATRSPVRPNPIALTCVEVLCIDYENGIIEIPYIDANDHSPILDIKPYTPSLDRVDAPHVPDWCSHWPKSLEESADFEWEKEFNF